MPNPFPNNGERSNGSEPDTQPSTAPSAGSQPVDSDWNNVSGANRPAWNRYVRQSAYKRKLLDALFLNDVDEHKRRNIFGISGNDFTQVDTNNRIINRGKAYQVEKNFNLWQSSCVAATGLNFDGSATLNFGDQLNVSALLGNRFSINVVVDNDARPLSSITVSGVASEIEMDEIGLVDSATLSTPTHKNVYHVPAFKKLSLESAGFTVENAQESWSMNYLASDTHLLDRDVEPGVSDFSYASMEVISSSKIGRTSISLAPNSDTGSFINPYFSPNDSGVKDYLPVQTLSLPAKIRRDPDVSSDVAGINWITYKKSHARLTMQQGSNAIERYAGNVRLYAFYTGIKQQASVGPEELKTSHWSENLIPGCNMRVAISPNIVEFGGAGIHFSGRMSALKHFCNVGVISQNTWEFYPVQIYREASGFHFRTRVGTGWQTDVLLAQTFAATLDGADIDGILDRIHTSTHALSTLEATASLIQDEVSVHVTNAGVNRAAATLEHLLNVDIRIGIRILMA